jgi:hypothetical protein
VDPAEPDEFEVLAALVVVSPPLAAHFSLFGVKEYAI